MKEQIDIQNIAKNKKKEIESKLEKRIKEIFPKFDVSRIVAMSFCEPRS